MNPTSTGDIPRTSELNGDMHETETHRDIQAEFRAVRRHLVDGETESVENVDDSGWEEKAHLHLRFVVNCEGESKVDVVGDEVRETGDPVNDSKSKVQFEHNV